LKQQAVNYVQFDDLVDFAQDHSFNTDRENYLTVTLPNLIKDPELWKE